MLTPDSRTIAFDLLRPPAGYRLDFAVLTTYTLDLEALLALPLSVLAHADGGLDELLGDPLRLHQALREAGDRVHVFVDAGGIAVPRSARSLFSMLESSVHAVRAPGGGAFHPKVWAARFTASDEAGEDRLRVAVLSRNLTFDRSWDIALVSEASPRKGRVTASAPLGDLLAGLPGLAMRPVASGVAQRVRALAEQAARTAFPAPEGFVRPGPDVAPASRQAGLIRFHALGLSRRRPSWTPPASGSRVLAVAPFVNQAGLDALVGATSGERILVSRREELDKLPADALADWEVLVLAEAAQGEDEDAGEGESGGVARDAGGGPGERQAEDDGGMGRSGAAVDRGMAENAAGDDRGSGAPASEPRARPPGRMVTAASSPANSDLRARPSGLHAKMIAVEHGWDVTWCVGSANLTAAAFGGANVEMMASVTGRKGRAGGTSGHGIDRFLDGGFRELCEPYERRIEPEPEDPRVTSARVRLEAARRALLEADLRVMCAAAGDLWTLTVEGAGALPGGDVEAAAWPLSLPEAQARRLDPAPSWTLPISRLTAFVAFRLRVPVAGVDDVRMTLRLPAQGMPADRMHHVLRALLDTPEKFLGFLRALLGGIDALPDVTKPDGDGNGPGPWPPGPGGETLLDDLLRAASRDPARLRPLRRLIKDLRKTEEGRRIVPDELLQLWNAVEEAVATRPPQEPAG